MRALMLPHYGDVVQQQEGGKNNNFIFRDKREDIFKIQPICTFILFFYLDFCIIWFELLCLKQWCFVCLLNQLNILLFYQLVSQ